MAYRYYCMEKPPMPGTVPRGMVGIVDFKEFRRVDEIGGEACGYVEYERRLTEGEMHGCGLVEAREHGCDEDHCEI